MERSILSKGRTVSEAVKLALDLLGASKEQVNLEIIEQGSKGLLGIKSKPAVVRAVLASPSPPAREPEDIINGLLLSIGVDEQPIRLGQASPVQDKPGPASNIGRSGWKTDRSRRLRRLIIIR